MVNIALKKILLLLMGLVTAALFYLALRGSSPELFLAFLACSGGTWATGKLLATSEEKLGSFALHALLLQLVLALGLAGIKMDIWGIFRDTEVVTSFVFLIFSIAEAEEVEPPVGTEA